MAQKNNTTIDRKEFLQKSTIGIAGLSIAGCPSSGKLRQSTAKNSLHYRTLGRTGLKVSFVAHGASRVEVPSVVKHGIDHGINFIDTGRMYAQGRNEEMIGKVVKDVRNNIIIQSKFIKGLIHNKAGILKSIEESLKALQTDYIDIILIHDASSEDDIFSSEVHEALTKAKENGKIRFTGFSTHKHQSETLNSARKSGFYDVAMVTYNHSGYYKHFETAEIDSWDQTALEKEIEKAVKEGMGIVAMKTCSAGPYKEKGNSKATFSSALKWIRNNPHISTTVPLMANFAEVEEDVQAMGEA